MDKEKLQRLNERMKVQMKLSWEKEKEVLKRFGLQDGMHILEIGSGPGYITEEILRLFPNSQVTAVEINPDFAQFSRQYLEINGDGRYQIIEGDILEVHFPTEQFDVAFARLVFQHLSDPVQVAQKIKTLLKPGGKFIITDVDDGIWGIVDPVIPELNRVMERHAVEQKMEGGNRFIGRQLWRILKQVGFSNLNLEALAIHSDEIGLDPFLDQFDLDEMRTMIDRGLITEEYVQQAQVGVERFLAAEYPYILMILLMICGQRV